MSMFRKGRTQHSASQNGRHDQSHLYQPPEVFSSNHHLKTGPSQLKISENEHCGCLLTEPATTATQRNARFALTTPMPRKREKGNLLVSTLYASRNCENPTPIRLAVEDLPSLDSTNTRSLPQKRSGRCNGATRNLRHPPSAQVQGLHNNARGGSRSGCCPSFHAPYPPEPVDLSCSRKALPNHFPYTPLPTA